MGAYGSPQVGIYADDNKKSKPQKRYCEYCGAANDVNFRYCRVCEKKRRRGGISVFAAICVIVIVILFINFIAPAILQAIAAQLITVSNITISKEDTLIGDIYYIELQIHNTTNDTLQFYFNSLELNGTSYNGFFTSDTLQPNSWGTVRFVASELISGTFSDFPVGSFRTAEGVLAFKDVNSDGAWIGLKFDLP